MKQYLLGALLVVQVLIVVAIWLVGLQGPKDPDPFLEFDMNAVDRLAIASTDESISLSKAGDVWTLPDGNPADERKLKRVLEKLANVTGDWPVATSERTAERFEVTKNAFQKHISVFAGDETLADIYIGTSPSFRLVHARAVNGGPVHAIEFANHDAGTTPNSWLDKSLLRPQGTITSLELVDSYVLTKDEGVWSVADETELDQSKVREYVERFETLSVFELSEADVSETEPSGQIVISDDDGSYTLTVYYVESSEDWVVHSDREVSHYGLASYVGSQVVKELVELSPDEEDEEDGEEILLEDGEAVMTVEDITDESE